MVTKGQQGVEESHMVRNGDERVKKGSEMSDKSHRGDIRGPRGQCTRDKTAKRAGCSRR